jgi:hypothetical protein
MENNLQKIEKQIEEQMKKAFFDLIDENVNSKNPDYEWIVQLYSEMIDRLLSFVKKDGKTYLEIKNSFDIELFKQMIENDVFEFESMLKLINTMFYWIEKLQAPIRDNYSKESKQRIFSSKPNKIISNFLKEVHICIDNIEKDLISFNESLKNKK